MAGQENWKGRTCKLAKSNLQKVLELGHFAVTAEVGPPRSADFSSLKQKAEMLRGYVDAINVTDNQTAIVRLSSQSCCGELARMGIDPVFQVTCRDRNRIALQSDILGAVAQGARNILCLSGDHQSFGSEPQAKNVFDLDSVQLIKVVAGMTEGIFAGGDRLEAPLEAFVGAAANPFADPLELRVRRLRKKIKAGARFIQTQCIYDMDRFARFMEQVRAEGLDRQAKMLAGVTPLKSAKAAKYMRDKVAGVTVPDDVIRRMEAAQDPREEGIRICVETIQKLKEMPGVAGVHIMAIAWEEVVPEIARRAGLAPRP
ncbi:methylenetetrahydrofolate reductase [Clostridiales bacterium PH28_bin88]|nr:methylenetetrahydrofolate reductase [Clostridiales bacterium PH28_bin88]